MVTLLHKFSTPCASYRPMTNLIEALASSAHRYFFGFPSANARLSKLIAALLSCTPLMAAASDLSIKVFDLRGRPVVDAVVYVELTNKASAQLSPAPRSKTSEVEQRGRQFLPLVSVIQSGSSVNFPNNDTVRHHVYSFSQAKVFELKLYSGIAGRAIVFDKPGTVVLGCNIHDSMVAFIHIVDTPWFAKTDPTGEARIPSLPNGSYRLRAWHYSLADQNSIAEQALSIAGSDTSTSISLDLKPFSLPVGAATAPRQ